MINPSFLVSNIIITVDTNNYVRIYKMAPRSSKVIPQIPTPPPQISRNNSLRNVPIKNVGLRSSSKTCIGVFCIENMTIFLLFVIIAILVYLYYANLNTRSKYAGKREVVPVNSYTTLNNTLSSTGGLTTSIPSTIVVSSPPVVSTGLGGLPSRMDPMDSLYAPPLKTDGMYFPPDGGDIRGLPSPVVIKGPTDLGKVVTPINVRTRGYVADYSQMGILTRVNGKGGDMILPLMGRQIANGRDKYQYYTMSTTGNLNTKLPISVNGRSCTSEYGCSELSDGDVVYVEGYNDTFRVTKYENGLFSYIPYL